MSVLIKIGKNCNTTQLLGYTNSLMMVPSKEIGERTRMQGVHCYCIYIDIKI